MIHEVGSLRSHRRTCGTRYPATHKSWVLHGAGRASCKVRDTGKKRASMAGTAERSFFRRRRIAGARAPLLLLFETLDLLLESLDFVPRLQPTTHDAEVKLLHKEK